MSYPSDFDPFDEIFVSGAIETTFPYKKPRVTAFLIHTTKDKTVVYTRASTTFYALLRVSFENKK